MKCETLTGIKMWYVAATSVNFSPETWSPAFLVGFIVGILIMAFIKR